MQAILWQREGRGSLGPQKKESTVLSLVHSPSLGPQGQGGAPLSDVCSPTDITGGEEGRQGGGIWGGCPGYGCEPLLYVQEGA